MVLYHFPIPTWYYDDFVLFLHDYSTKYKGSHWLISFICTWPFDQNIWPCFIHYFFSAWPFAKKIGSPFIYYAYLHTTIWPKYMVLFHLFFLLCTTIWPKIRVHTDLFLLFAHSHSTKIRCHSYFSNYFLNCGKTSYATFMAILSLYRYIPILAVLPLYSVCYIYGWMKS